MGNTTVQGSHEFELLKKAVASLPRVRERCDAYRRRLTRVRGLLEAQKRHRDLLAQTVTGLERRILELEALSQRIDTEA